VEPAQRLLGDCRQRVAVLLVAGLADRQGMPLDLEALARGGRAHDLDAFGHDLEPDVIAQQDADLQHSLSPPNLRTSASLSADCMDARGDQTSIQIVECGDAYP